MVAKSPLMLGIARPFDALAIFLDINTNQPKPAKRKVAPRSFC